MADQGISGGLVAAPEFWHRFRQDPGLPSLILAYNEELGVVTDPDWSLMTRRAAVGDLHTFTLRNLRNALCGFCLCEMRALTAFKGRRLAFADNIYVEPRHRPAGRDILIDEVCRYMRDKGASQFAMHHHAEPACVPPLGAVMTMRVLVKELRP